MVLKIKWTIKNFAEVEKQLEEFENEFGNIVEESLEETIFQMLRDAKDETAPLSFRDRTGNLRANIGATKKNCYKRNDTKRRYY